MRAILSAALLLATLTAQAQLAPDTQAKIAAAAEQILHDTGVPSASVAVVQNGKVAYAQAFGLANIAPPKPATPAMAYPIGSISKQFTATAVLLLQQEGKLSIDDPVSKYFPELTRSHDVTLRNLMTMTSGYEDFAPQDYIIPAWRHPVDSNELVHQWAGKPLDFEPGTEWQYSNTNYVLVALIVQKVAGVPFAQFIRDRVLRPAGLLSGAEDGVPNMVFNTYTQRDKLQVTGYVSYAMAPPRVLPLEATGWYFGDGDLAMPAATLATWDLTFINKSLLSPASYTEMETPFTLKNGADSHYGFGIFVREIDGHHEIEHSGEVGGFVAENAVFPDDKAAVVVLTNEVASSAAAKIAAAIRPLILPSAAPTPANAANPAEAFIPQLKTILTGLQSAQIERSLFTADCNDYFSPEALGDFKSTLAPLGAIKDITLLRTNHRGGMTFGLYRVQFSSGIALTVDTYLMPDGKIEQLLVIGKA